MTDEEILDKWAGERGQIVLRSRDLYLDLIRRVREDERERCAAIVVLLAKLAHGKDIKPSILNEVAAAIRSRKDSSLSAAEAAKGGK